MHLLKAEHGTWSQAQFHDHISLLPHRHHGVHDPSVRFGLPRLAGLVSRVLLAMLFQATSRQAVQSLRRFRACVRVRSSDM